MELFLSDQDWDTAPRLVSDLKVQLQRRHYPRRDITLDDLRAALADLPVSSLHLAAMERLLDAGDGTFLSLARFQKDAIVQQMRNLRERGDRALVIGAGTGAGKTKAFYIPALAHIAATLTDAHAVSALAIYPRVELLKDQLAEALSETEKLRPFLRAGMPHAYPWRLLR